MLFFIKQRTKMKNQNGFTLIELLIVIAILAILALLGLPRLAQFIEDSKISEAIATGEVIGRAAEAVLASNPDLDPAIVIPGDLEAYLTPETYLRIPTDYVVVITVDGVTVTYQDTDVTLTVPLVYDSQ